MKFVSANTLVRLEHVDEAKELFSNKDILELIDELKAIRHELFVVTDQHTKAKLLMKDEGLRQKIMLTIGESVTSDIEARISAKKEILANLENELLDAEKMDDKILTKTISADLFGEKTETITYSLKEETIKDVKSRISKAKGEIKRLTESLVPGRDKAISLAKKLTDWNPYDQNVSSPFFDPEWMFGVKDGFDIIIGNPPYIKEYTNKDAFDCFRMSMYYQGKMDIWYGFACLGIDFLCKKGLFLKSATYRV